MQVPADGAGAHVARGLRAVPPLPRGPGQQVLLQRQQHLLSRGLLQVRCHVIVKYLCHPLLLPDIILFLTIDQTLFVISQILSNVSSN